MAVLNRKADIGAASTASTTGAGRRTPALTQICHPRVSPEVPSNASASGKDLEQGNQGKAEGGLLSLHNEPEGTANLTFWRAQVHRTTAKAYQPVFDMANKAGIDIRRYNYRNQ